MPHEALIAELAARRAAARAMGGPGKLAAARTAAMRTENKQFLACREHLSALLRRGLRVI